MTEFKDTILGKITYDAIYNWDTGWNGESSEERASQAEEMMKNFDTPQKARDGKIETSDIAATDKLIEILGLSEEQAKQLKNEIETSDRISPELKEVIRNGVNSDVILEMLSAVHDNWVKNHPDNFLLVKSNGKARNKEYQFVDLKLLDFKEASLDLLFLQPILEACDIAIDRQMLEEKFLQEQREYLQQQGIDSHEALVEKISSGAEFYPALEGLETNKGAQDGEKTPITELLKDQEIVEKMAGQVEDRIAPSMLENAKAKNNELVKISEQLKEAETLVKAVENAKDPNKNPGIGE